jgi:hypothetical protein
MKTCSKCGETKPLTEFSKRVNSNDGHDYWCKACHVKQHRERKAKDPLFMKKRNIKSAYGLPWEEYLQLTTNGCEVCGTHDNLCVDHDHATGKVRGCLCTHCNSTLGYAKDNPQLLRKLADYLEAKQND